MSDTATSAQVLAEIAALTAPACGNSPECMAQGHVGEYRCCSRLYCEAARRYCQSKGIALTDTGHHPDLPFMGPDGCILPPEHRPICAIHTCQWSGSADPHCGDEATTLRYAEIYKHAAAIDDGWWEAFESARDEVNRP